MKQAQNGQLNHLPEHEETEETYKYNIKPESYPLKRNLMGCAGSRMASARSDDNGNLQTGKEHGPNNTQQDPKPVQQDPKPVQQDSEPVQQDSEPVQVPCEPTSVPDKPVEKEYEAVIEPAEPDKPVPEYTEETLKEFLLFEKKLSHLEKRNIAGEYERQHNWLVSLYGNLQTAQKKVNELKEQTVKEYQDVAYMQHPSVRAMFSDVYQLQSQMAKEQQEYMDALNRQEVAEKELKGIQQEYNTLYAEVDALRKEYEELGSVRSQQEKTLDQIFGGKYGSELEEQLEVETDLLNERKELITKTRSHWHNGKVLMQHAADQLSFSTRRWAQINTVSQEYVQARYSMVAETRNYLIAASQNITNTHRYLSNVNIPYCNHEDLKILNNAIATIFNDVLNRDCYARALQTYNSLQSRAATLLQWINMVLEKTINKDLEKIVPECQTKITELRRERLRLIHVKLSEIQGTDIENNDIAVDDELESESFSPGDTHIAEPDAVSLREETQNKDDVAPALTMEENVEASGQNETQDLPIGENHTESESATVAAKPLTELAPVPTQDILFGNIEELKIKYEEQVAEFSKAQDVNKARVDQALQEKLRARRSRKNRVELQQLETAELLKGVTQQ